MTTGHDSLAALLATSLIGPATGDPYEDAIQAAFLSGAARLGEMDQTGFATTTPFANVDQEMYVGEGRKPFLLVSLGTNTTYFVVLAECVGGDLRVFIAVHQGDQNPKTENLRKMTLMRGGDGNVYAKPGW